LQKVTGTGHTDWTAFCKAVCTATLTQIDEAKEEEKEARDLREQVRKLQELRDTSTRNVTNALQRLTVNTPTPPPLSYTPSTAAQLAEPPPHPNIQSVPSTARLPDT
jgi:hypothetical protein